MQSKLWYKHKTQFLSSLYLKFYLSVGPYISIVDQNKTIDSNIFHSSKQLLCLSLDLNENQDLKFQVYLIQVFTRVFGDIEPGLFTTF